MVKILICEPNKDPYLIETDDLSYEFLENIVGTSMEYLHCGRNIVVIRNSSDNARMLKPNKFIYGKLIFGTFIFCKIQHHELAGLFPDDLNYIVSSLMKGEIGI